MTLDRDLVAAALPNYEVDGEIGRGGWGVVLHGRHRALGREVAIKQLPRELAARESALERFVDEARIIGQLDHPHIVKVYDFVQHDGLCLLVMEYLSGGTLWDRFTQTGLRSDQACVITLAVCAGLDAANEQGVLHRDIKPENILFTQEGIPRLGDFGIAKDLGTEMRRTRVGEVVGTPTYMSPEQAMGDDVTRACDVYSLAVVLYELLAGRLPFAEARTPAQQMVQHVSETPVALTQTAPEVPTVIADVVMNALEKRPEDRIGTAQAFGVSLAHAAGDAFGPEWLGRSGIQLMGGGRIQAAAQRWPTAGAPSRTPTLARPAHRTDHFRPDEGGDADVPNPPEIDQVRSASPTIGPAAAATSGSDQQRSTQPTAPPSPAPGGPTASPDAAQSSGGGRRRLLVGSVLAAAAVILVVVVLAVLTLSGGGDDSANGAGADTPDSGVDQAGGDTCPVATRCTFIDSVAIDGDSLVVEWTAIGFEPSFEEGFVHAHFFWDIYSADQAGTNAATFGVTEGEWEIAQAQPFRSTSEMRVQNKPIPANQVCVTAANFAHAVINPLQFDCAPLPEGM